MTQVARGLWGLDTLHGLYLARDAAAESKYLPKLTTILKKKNEFPQRENTAEANPDWS